MEDSQDGAVASSSAAQHSTLKKPLVVHVDESHPFDLESYIANYSGKLISSPRPDANTFPFNQAGLLSTD